MKESLGGTVVAIFGPSGSGKSRQKNIFKKNGWNEIVSYVTRPPRGESDIEYEFATEDEWQEEYNRGNLINVNRYGGNFYGTKISDFRNAGKSILVTDITNVDGSRGDEDLNKIAARENKRLVLLFSAPPEPEELMRRHKERFDSGEYDDSEEYENRLATAGRESVKMWSEIEKLKGLGVVLHTIYNDEDAVRLARELA